MKKKLNTLDAEIREVVYKFEDLLDLFIYNQLLPQNEKRNGDESQLPLVHISLQDLEQDVHTFTETLKDVHIQNFKPRISLIVSWHLSIKLYRALSPLPLEIWELKQSKHLQVAGRDLEDPNGTFVCPNFSTLLDVSPHSCTKSVSERVPKLKKLRIQIELAPDQAVDEPLCCFDNIFHLKELESLKCVVVNPTFRPEVVSPLVPLSIVSSSLKTFCLSGLGYPWEEMSRINASLPNLEVLKLVWNAFRGPKWETEEHIFLKLKYLLIEDTDLVQWNVGIGSFPRLKRLSIRHCYKLKEIYGELNDILGIEVVAVVTCLKQMVLSERRHVRVSVDVHSSWLEDDSQLAKKGVKLFL